MRGLRFVSGCVVEGLGPRNKLQQSVPASVWGVQSGTSRNGFSAHTCSALLHGP